MKRKWFSVEQIVAILKQAEMGMPVAELIRRVGISEQTFYRWKKQFAGLENDQVRRASGRHTSSADSFSLEAFLDWLAPIVVLIVIGGMIFALVGTMLAPLE